MKGGSKGEEIHAYHVIVPDEVTALKEAVTMESKDK